MGNEKNKEAIAMAVLSAAMVLCVTPPRIAARTALRQRSAALRRTAPHRAAQARNTKQSHRSTL